MTAKMAKPAQLADPTIDQVFGDFLAEQRQRLKPKTVSRYENVIHLLRHHLNGYGHEGLSKAESALFDKHYNASGAEHREFCQLFGPSKIVQNLPGFLGYFMIRKVVAGQELKRAAGTVTKKLAKWLAAKGYISQDEAEEEAHVGAEAARKLPNAERAAGILFDAAEDLAVFREDLTDRNYVEFDHFRIKMLEPGKLWLENFAAVADSLYGPVPVPRSATSLLREGWEISCALGRVRGKWRIIEVANVYPR